MNVRRLLEAGLARVRPGPRSGPSAPASIFGLEPERLRQWDGLTLVDRLVATDGPRVANAYLQARRGGRLLPSTLPKIGTGRRMIKAAAAARHRVAQRGPSQSDPFARYADRFAQVVHGAPPADPRFEGGAGEAVDEAAVDRELTRQSIRAARGVGL